MSDDTIGDTPTRLTDAELTTYWNSQMSAVQALRRIGITYDLRDRIEPMKAYRLLRKLERRQDLKDDQQAHDLIDQARSALEALVYLRTIGFEPDNRNNRYI